MYCYFNNGMSMKTVAANYTPLSGEQVFSDYQNPTQLAAAFSGYTAAVAADSNSTACLDALNKSDTTMHRITEAVSLGLTTWTTADVVAWVEYRRSLRAGTLASKPPYPVGT